MAPRRALSILSPSQNHAVVRTVDDYIRPHGYAIGETLESDPFSAQGLALALRVLEPRPQVVLVGRGYPEDETTQARKIFAEYMKEVGVDKGTVIKITPKVFDEVGKEGVPKWVLQQLKDRV
jgi:hypothetical protein